MSIKYVDYSGSAGLGDGSSFANRANQLRSVTGVSAGDEIRVKKTKDPTLIGTGQVKLGPSWGNYSAQSVAGARITYSPIDGETKITQMGLGWETGDIIHVLHPDTTTGKSISGVWQVTVESGTASNANLKLDGFPGIQTSVLSSTSFRWWPMINAIKLNTSGLTKSIACRDTNRGSWTATGTAVTTDYSHPTYTDWNKNLDHRLWTGRDQIYVGTTASNGKLAYYELPNSLDLSGYQQVSFLINTNAVTNQIADDLSLRLCTDTAGNTSVHTIPIDFKNQKASTWTSFTHDFGTNLNSSIQSIALYQDSTPAHGITINLQNIIACKASSANDSLALNKLIGLNTVDDPAWYPIDFIWDDIVVLNTHDLVSPHWGYYGSSAAAFSATNTAADIYVREQVRPYDGLTYPPTQSDYGDWDYISASGTEANRITIRGGWDETSMSTRNGKTCIELNGSMSPHRVQDYTTISDFYYSNFFRFNSTGPNHIKYERIGYSNCEDCLSFNTGNQHVDGIGIDFLISGTYNGVAIYQGTYHGSPSDYYIKQGIAGNYRGAIVTYYTSPVTMHWDYINSIAGGGEPIRVNSASIITINNLLYGYNARVSADPQVFEGGSLNIINYTCTQPYYRCLFAKQANIVIQNVTQTLDSTFGVTYKRFGRHLGLSYNYYVDVGGNITVMNAGNVLTNSYIKGTLQIKDSTNSFSYSLQSGGVLESINHHGVSGDNKVFFYGGATLEPETTTRHTNSGVAWRALGTTKLKFSLGSVLVNANSQVTVGLWVYVDTSAEVTLKVPTNLKRGITSPVSVDSSSVSTNTWTKIQLNFTPTTAGPVEIEVEAIGNSWSSGAIIDDLEVSQV